MRRRRRLVTTPLLGLTYRFDQHGDLVDAPKMIFDGLIKVFEGYGQSDGCTSQIMGHDGEEFRQGGWGRLGHDRQRSTAS